MSKDEDKREEHVNDEIGDDERVKRAKEKIDDEFIKSRAKRISEDDVRKVLEREKEIEEKFSSGGPLRRFIEDFKLLISLVRDYWNGTYREVPWLTIAALVFALLYVLSPIDLIPDFIPVIGYLDDAAVVALCLRLFEQDLHNYKDWKRRNPKGGKRPKGWFSEGPEFVVEPAPDDPDPGTEGAAVEIPRTYTQKAT